MSAPDGFLSFSFVAFDAEASNFATSSAPNEMFPELRRRLRWSMGTSNCIKNSESCWSPISVRNSNLPSPCDASINSAAGTSTVANGSLAQSGSSSSSQKHIFMQSPMCTPCTPTTSSHFSDGSSIDSRRRGEEAGKLPTKHLQSTFSTSGTVPPKNWMEIVLPLILGAMPEPSETFVWLLAAPAAAARLSNFATSSAAKEMFPELRRRLRCRRGTSNETDNSASGNPSMFAWCSNLPSPCDAFARSAAEISTVANGSSYRSGSWSLSHRETIKLSPRCAP
mmetsp:Transcript_21314/g.46278  ORF Transcript_21314/g.46278 Transcript_21314/m.46278 type:complete len:281 (+) Transcript_21314:214-1056(+)|eukprot:CAMPEP_0206500256 /NCGR_PEP_ID=MMETSP0324_2-20121206/52287_1 /ASSEMBLY_ACC=CAM_ASM_000836 /TAXON_ID=2866 /ORGANISM="Crypthecodinium cohnii, Strain Seligo" /LENGTH=280 /DNA_ID=CAMNT_0053987211 /DNA_START=114 /DNA_END=956 /DNA_ORIENTATION=+